MQRRRTAIKDQREPNKQDFHHDSPKEELSYQGLVEHIPAVVYCDTLDDEDGACYMSPQLHWMLADPDSVPEPSQQSWSACLHPEDRDRVLAERRRALKEAQPLSCEYRLISHDGQVRWVLDQARVVHGTDGTRKLHGILHDITERKTLEQSQVNRDAILQAVTYAAEYFLRQSRSDVPMETVLGRLGEATRASRVYVFENSLAEDGTLLTSQKYEWAAKGISSQKGNPDLENFPIVKGGFSRWLETFLQGEPIHGLIEDFPPSERPVLEAQGIISLVAAPIFVNGALWGFMGFDDCVLARRWTPAEIDALKTAAHLVGAMVQKQRADAIVDQAARHLEEEVARKTAELKEANARLYEELKRRREAQARLEESERRYRELYERSRDGYVRTDFHGVILECNRPFARMLGYDDPQEILGVACRDMTPPQRFDAISRAMRQQLMDRGFSDKFEKQLIRKDGSLLDVEVRMYLHRSPDGTPDSIWTFVQDLSDRKLAEQERLRAQKLESLGLLAGGIAHDFNNILAGILGHISLIKHLIDNETSTGDRLDHVEKACVRAQELTRQLLTFAKGGAPIKKTGSLQDLIRDCTEFSLRGTPSQARFDLPEDLWLVDYDATQIGQVLQNLVINAHQAMPHGGTVTVEAQNVLVEAGPEMPLRPGRYVAVSVQDHGVGIPKEHMEAIFDPYFTTKKKGSGLGLPTAYSIVKRHDGHMTVHSHLGQGTRVTFYLPASQKVTDASVALEDHKPLQGTGRILIMDDDPIVRDVLSAMLQHLGFESEATVEGMEALARYQQALAIGKPFDGVILDLTVPGGVGGREVVEKLQALDPHVRAVASTGYSNDPVLSQPQAYGFRAGIAKPYRMEDLEKVLRRVLSDGPKPAKT
ncbi:hybrid sensor histidine kinase/response regulator [Desulfosoma caldarium]|uniref:histidine kinase n=1 Tax=Desulfosoma caldarium TaxID=610254 RepID=A0A3N1VJG5_9BACT|nr:PAS domain S-box protein [Desulfosoma caldarium]ROR02943.1 PAS domain S-box-containing protein [Desulfosoma caldarium]